MYPQVNITSQGRFAFVKKTHKAVLGALFVSEKPLLPFENRGKVYWTLDFLLPTESTWDTRHPLILTDLKAREMVELSYVVADPDGNLALTNYGHIVADGSQWDWNAYWNMFYGDRMGPRFDWVKYFKTGFIDASQLGRR
jgi:hypothetical protein